MYAPTQDLMQGIKNAFEMQMLPWDEYFMRIALVVASRATCDRKHVGAVLVRDRFILATGYKVELERLPFLKNGNVFDKVEVKNGFPVLDPYFQTTAKGLYFTSMPAGQDFGPFFGFTVSVRASAKIIGNALKQ